MSDSEKQIYYTLSYLQHPMRSGFRYLGGCTEEEALAMMTGDDVVLCPLAGVERLHGILNNPAESDQLVVFQVEGEAGERSTLTGNWGIDTVPMPDVDAMSQEDYDAYLRRHGKYKDYYVLVGWDIETAKQMLQILPPSDGATLN